MATADELAIIVTAQTQEVLNGLQKVTGSINKLTGATGKAEKASNSLTSASKGMGRSLLGLAAKLGGVVGAAVLVGKGLRNAGIKEQGEIQFKTLLGSAELAQQRMKELADFANSTPFSNEQVVGMSKTLQAMTGGALASGAGLRLVGDTAAALNPDELERFSLHMGRMFTQIKNGQAFGESLKELGEMGAISGDVAVKLKKMQDAGADGEAIWATARGEFEKNSGAMKDLSQTAGGSMSTLVGTFNDVLADAFRPITDALTPVMADLTAGLETMRPILIGIGEKIGAAVTKLKQGVQFLFSVFSGGDLGSLIANSLKLGGMTFVNWFFGVMKAVFDFLPRLWKAEFAILASPSFWVGVLEVFAGVGQILAGAAAVFTGHVIQAGAEFFGFISAVGTFVKDFFVNAFILAGNALLGLILEGAQVLIDVGNKLHFPGMDKAQEIVENVQSGLAGSTEDATNVIGGLGEEFTKNKESAAKAVDTFGQDLVNEGKLEFEKGLTGASEGFNKVGSKVGEKFSESFDGFTVEPADIFDTGPIKDKLGGLVNDHWPAETDEAAKDVADGAKKTGDSIADAVNPDAVVDSLTKIGGGGNIFVAAAEASQSASGGGGLGGAAVGLSPAEKGRQVIAQHEANLATKAESLNGSATASSKGLGAGGSVGGDPGTALLGQINEKMSRVIELMSSPTSGGGGLTIEAS